MLGLRRAGAISGSLVLLLLGGCRESDSSGPTARPLPPSTAGVNGCSAAAPGLGSAPVAVPLAQYQADGFSQVTAAAGGPLYLTGAGATVWSVDLSDPFSPVEQQLVDPTAIAALYTALGLPSAPQLSGLAVLDEARLVVMEHSANLLLEVSRTAANQVGVLAGFPDEVPGFADGPAEFARFSFDVPCQVLPIQSDGLELYVADSGNHALRLVTASPGGAAQVLTVAGAGFPLFQDGELQEVLLDSPSGLTVTCDDSLLVSELGVFGFGQRIREARFQTSIFSGLGGQLVTLVGDGIAATTAGSAALAPSGSLAQVAQPVSPLATTTGEVLWVDSGTGVLRRLANGQVDCPLAASCDGAAADFTPGGLCSLTQTGDGTLYVLDAQAGALYRLP